MIKSIHTTTNAIVVITIALCTPKLLTKKAEKAGAAVLPIPPQVRRKVTKIAGAF